jgi:hypothetical protein
VRTQNWVLEQAELDAVSHARLDDLESLASSVADSPNRFDDGAHLPSRQRPNQFPPGDPGIPSSTSKVGQRSDTFGVFENPDLIVGVDFRNEGEMTTSCDLPPLRLSRGRF